MYDFNNDKQLNMQRNDITNAVEIVISQNRGEVVLFPIIEKVRELVYCAADIANGSQQFRETIVDVFELNPLAIKESDLSVSGCTSSLKIIHGTTTSEQKSEFQSHVCAVSSMEEVREFKRVVLEDKKVLIHIF